MEIEAKEVEKLIALLKENPELRQKLASVLLSEIISDFGLHDQLVDTVSRGIAERRRRR